jgi:hypothetical protein
MLSNASEALTRGHCRHTGYGAVSPSGSKPGEPIQRHCLVSRIALGVPDIFCGGVTYGNGPQPPSYYERAAPLSQDTEGGKLSFDDQPLRAATRRSVARMGRSFLVLFF